MSDRNGSSRFKQRQRCIRRRIRQAHAVDFFNVLTGAELLEITEAHLPEHRERLYPPTVSLAMFMNQALSADGSCQKAVNAWAAQRAAQGLSAHSVRTGAYCRARQRLPLQMVSTLTREAARVLSQQAPAPWRWRGRTVKLVDGTGVSMPDTPENQARYPQPRSQAQGVGFPLARLVVVICLATGGVLQAAVGPFEGKGHSELALFRGLLEVFEAGELMLADALYCNYFVVAALKAAGVDVLFEQNGSRRTDFRRGYALGRRDHLVIWPKPPCPEWMSPEQYRSLPEELLVREAKVGQRVLVTTMLDARRVRKDALGELYERRWNVELDLRNIKTTLGMEILRCRTPQMVEKELWVNLLAYNLIRMLMAQAAREAGLAPRELSFKHSVQLYSAWSARAAGDEPEQRHCLYRLIAQLRVGHRPGRIEPRARKRRPKSYPWLKVPRAQARQQIRTHGYLLNA